MSEEKRWYYAREGKPQGPLTEHEFCKLFSQGTLGANDFVFCKGEMTEWVKAETVPGLCNSSLELSPEPEPEHHAAPAHERAGLTPTIGHKRMKKQKVKRQKAYWDLLKKKKKL